MMLRMPLALLLAGLFVHAAAAAPATQPVDPYPAQTLSNGQVTLSVYLPDAQKGYYRSSRFDWSGMISRVEYEGHTFFAPFKPTHDPMGTDDVIGTAEEFGMDTALGYDDAEVGGTFLKIGVGQLRKEQEPGYQFGKRYAVVKPGEWKIDFGKDWIAFAQTAANDNGYAYAYSKRITLRPDGFTISHHLRNTGAKRIETDHYGHNFVIIDDEPIGPAYRIAFPFPARFSEKIPPKLHDIAKREGRSIVFTRPIPPGTAIWAPLEGANTIADNAVIVQNIHSGAIPKIAGDRPPVKFVLYAQRTAVCPESFIKIELEPGQETSWASRYTLIIGPAAK